MHKKEFEIEKKGRWPVNCADEYKKIIIKS